MKRKRSNRDSASRAEPEVRIHVPPEESRQRTWFFCEGGCEGFLVKISTADFVKKGPVSSPDEKVSPNARQREDPRDRRGLAQPPAGLPEGIRLHARHGQSSDLPARRTHARADLAARLRPAGDRRSALLHRNADGRTRPRLGA